MVSGDVFDANQLAPRVISQSLEAMRAIGVPTYLLPGNHDPLDAASVYRVRYFPRNVLRTSRCSIAPEFSMSMPASRSLPRRGGPNARPAI